MPLFLFVERSRLAWKPYKMHDTPLSPPGRLWRCATGAPLGALVRQLPLAWVAPERCRGLELRPALIEAADLGEEVAAKGKKRPQTPSDP